MGPGMWPSAMMPTTAWRAALSRYGYPAFLDVLRAKTRLSCGRVRREGMERERGSERASERARGSWRGRLVPLGGASFWPRLPTGVAGGDRAFPWPLSRSRRLEIRRARRSMSWTMGFLSSAQWLARLSSGGRIRCGVGLVESQGGSRLRLEGVAFFARGPVEPKTFFAPPSEDRLLFLFSSSFPTVPTSTGTRDLSRHWCRCWRRHLTGRLWAGSTGFLGGHRDVCPEQGLAQRELPQS